MASNITGQFVAATATSGYDNGLLTMGVGLAAATITMGWAIGKVVKRKFFTQPPKTDSAWQSIHSELKDRVSHPPFLWERAYEGAHSFDPQTSCQELDDRLDSSGLPAMHRELREHVFHPPMIREGAEDARRFDPQVQCKLADARLAAPMHDAKWRAVDYQMKNVHRMLSRAPGWNPSKQCAHLDKHIEIVRECEAYREVEKDALSQANQRWRFLRVNEQIKFGRDFERGTSQDHPLLGSREDSEIMARWKQYRRF